MTYAISTVREAEDGVGPLGHEPVGSVLEVGGAGAFVQPKQLGAIRCGGRLGCRRWALSG
jgi:hypothetical protein